MLLGLMLAHALTAGLPAGADAVRWTVPETMDAEQLAELWGLPAERLGGLNPELDAGAPVEAGARLVVFSASMSPATRSLGHPADGRLQRGLPMPEGEGWTLRRRRRRAYGSLRAVRGLTRALQTWRDEHPGAPPVRLGELSRRRGGDLPPHLSHQSGRDVDLGYVFVAPDPGADPERFRLARPEVFDAAATWDLIRALADTGDVEHIFVSATLLPALHAAARQAPGGADLGRFFRSENPDFSAPVLLSHAKGHRDHMHVRFRCMPGQDRCRARRPG